MLKTIIIEDEFASQNLLSTIIEEFCPNCQYHGAAATFDEALELIRKVAPNLIFMDIELKGTTAFDILDELENHDFNIIFTTAYQEHAFKAFEYEAIDYLLKPYSPKDVIKAIARIKTHYMDKSVLTLLKDVYDDRSSKESNSKLSVHTSEGISLFNIDDIIRVEANGSYSTLFLTNKKKYVTSNNLSTIEKKISRFLFFRTHDSHLVNLSYISQYIKEDGGYVILSDKSRVPISRRKKQVFIDQLAKL